MCLQNNSSHKGKQCIIPMFLHVVFTYSKPKYKSEILNSCDIMNGRYNLNWRSGWYFTNWSFRFRMPGCSLITNNEPSRWSCIEEMLYPGGGRREMVYCLSFHFTFLKYAIPGFFFLKGNRCRDEKLKKLLCELTLRYWYHVSSGDCSLYTICCCLSLYSA